MVSLPVVAASKMTWDYCEVKIRCGMDSVNSGKSRSQSDSRHCTRFLWPPDSAPGHIVVTNFPLVCSQRLVVEC